MQKNLRISAEVEEKFNKIKSDLNFKTDVDTFIFLITSYLERETMAQNISRQIEERLKKTFDRIRLSSSASERYGYVILDVINTMLYDFDGADILIPANGRSRHQIIVESQDNLRKLIESRKQIKDNEIQKKGIIDENRNEE